MIRQAVGAIALSLFSLQSNAALFSRAGGQAYYDDVLNITWLADANAAAGSVFDDGPDPNDGLMTWGAAQAWIASLNEANYLGFNDWRLPNVAPVDGSTFDYSISYDGSTDQGWNISAPGSAYPGSTGSEMAHLFFNTLGNIAELDISGNETGCGNSEPALCLTSFGPFSNLQPVDYWSGSEYAPLPTSAWGFSFAFGGQDADAKTNNDVAAWAVRTGDMGLVPIPAAAWLFGGALAGLVVLKRRQATA